MGTALSRLDINLVSKNVIAREGQIQIQKVKSIIENLGAT